MMQVSPKWKVTATFDSGLPPHQIWLYDNFISNILRKVADIQFTGSGLIQPVSITIELVANPQTESSNS